MNTGAHSRSSIAIRVSGRIRMINMMKGSLRACFGHPATSVGGTADENLTYSPFEGGAGGCLRLAAQQTTKGYPPSRLLIEWIFTAVIGVLIFCAAASAYAQRTEAPQPVSDFVSGLESNLTEALKVADLLEPGRRELCALMRYYGPAAKAWQLEPGLAKEMGDQELFDYVVTRARSALAGGCELMSRHDCRNIDKKIIEKSKIREKYWSETSSGQCHISADGTFLTDSDGQPATLKNRSDLQDYWKLQKKFKGNNYQALISSSYWETPVFRSNLTYLKKEFGTAFEEQPEMAKALRLPPGGNVYAAPIMNLTYYIQYLDRQPPKVVFVAPLSW
jgi:hypothetical protein